MPTAVVAVQTGVDFGGSYTWLQQILEELPRFGWQFTVALSSDQTHRWRPFARRYEGLADITILQSRTGTPRGRQNAIENVLQSVSSDVVIPHHVFDVFPAVSHFKQAGGEVRLVYCAHEISGRAIADSFVYAGVVDLAVGVSRFLGRILRDVAKIPAERVTVIHSGVPRSVVPHASPSNDAPLRIGYAGRLEDDKRVLDMLPFCEELDRIGLDYRLEIAGHGSREQELQTALLHHVKRGRVRFLGFFTREQLYHEVYPHWDAFLSCSASEGWGIALVEAMINGIAPLVSDFRGRKQEHLLRNEQTALVFPVGDLRAAALACKRIADDRPLLHRLQTAAKHEVNNRFTISRMAEAWNDALVRALVLPIAHESPRFIERSAGRLDRFLGVRLGEVVRQRLRRRPVADESWPHVGSFAEGPGADLDARISALIEEDLEE